MNYLQQVQQYIDQLDYADARMFLLDILEKNRNLPKDLRYEITVELAKINYVLGAYESAKSECNFALQLNPHCDEAHLVLAKIAIREYFFSKAQGHLASVRNPTAQVHLTAAHLFLCLRDLERSKKSLDLARRIIPPTSLMYRILIAWMNLLCGNAIDTADVTTFLKETRKKPEELLILAEVLEIAGLDSPAESSLDISSAITPAHDHVYALRSQIAFNQQKLAEAESLSERSLKLNKTNALAMTIALKIAVRTGAYEKAEEIGATLLKTCPEYSLGHANIGDVYFVQGKFDEAKDEYLAADTIMHTATKGSKLRQARLLYIAGKLRDAQMILEQLLIPNDLIYDDAICDLWQIYDLLGEQEKKEALVARMETRKKYSGRIAETLKKIQAY